MSKNPIPKWVAWEVTRRCNLKCVHCRSSSDESIDQGALSFDEGKKLLTDLAEYGNTVVVLTGGEPLLHPRVFDYARIGTDLGLRMCLATNGTLVNTETCERMKETGIRMVSLSIDGATADQHDAFRGQPGAFDATIEAAHMLRDAGISFLVNSSFTRRNKDQIPAVRDLAKSLGATAWYMFIIVPTGRGEDLLAELISGPEYDELLNWHYDAEREETEMLMRPTCAPHYYRIWHQRARAEGGEHGRRSLLFSSGGGKGCVAGQTIALVEYQGDVKPCSYFLASAGNLRERSFREIWDDSDMMVALRDRSRYNGRCGQCEYWGVCGGCRVRAHALEGDYLAEEPFCNYVPRRMKAAGEDATEDGDA